MIFQAKNTQRAIVIFAVLFLSFGARAQTLVGGQVHPVRLVGAGVAPALWPWNSAAVSPEKPQGITRAYSYFDPNLQTQDLIGHGLYTPYVTVTLGERITLDADSGYVDSVTIAIDSVNQDSLFVWLFPDTLVSDPGSGQSYHLMNFFDNTSQPYASAVIQASEVVGPSLITVHFPRVKVPKNFFVTVSPNSVGSGQFSNYFFLRCDQELEHTVTTDNARSAWFGVDTQTGTEYSWIVDGIFTLGGSSDPLFTNFYVTAYAESAEAGVVGTNSPTRSSGVYPNPAKDRVRLTLESAGENSVTVFDLLGRKMLDLTAEARRTREIEFSTRDWLPGSYQVVEQTATGLMAHQFLLVK